MTRVDLLKAKIVCGLGLAVLLCCAAPWVGQGADPQAGTDNVNPVLDCPNAELVSIDTLSANMPDITQGIRGLPCKAKIEKDKPRDTSEADATKIKLQDGFDYYSWLTFIALNSPADGKTPIGKDARAVWETWKQLPDVMLSGGANPEKWANPNIPILPPACAGKSKDGTMIIHMEMDETYNEPFKSGPLFDQNGNYALFVIFMNQEMFDYIATNSLYSVAGQRSFEGEINFPNGTRDDTTKKGTLGAVMVKASWKILKPGVDYDPKNPNNPSIKRRFHMTDALLYNPKLAESCRPVKLGMIGFHVGHKTDDRQQWVWTTFEHHENVPTEETVRKGIPKGTRFSFYNPVCNAADCPINQTPPWPWDPDKLRPAWDPMLHPSSFKSQIVRMGPSPIFQHVEVLNSAFQTALGDSVWKNYDLITTQWPSDLCAKDPHPGSLPDATCAPFPTFLANTTLETFSQRETADGVPMATSSCIACHNNATTHHRPATRSDFTYILEKAQ